MTGQPPTPPRRDNLTYFPAPQENALVESEEVFDQTESSIANNFWQMVRIVLSFKWLILAITLLGSGISAVMVLNATPLYRTEATIEVQKQETQIIEGSNVDPVTIADAEFMATQFELLKSRSLAERVVETLGLLNDPRYADQSLDREARLNAATSKVRRNLAVAPSGRSRVMRVIYTSPDPREAARIANAVTDNFIQQSLDRKYATTAYARRFLRERIAATKVALEESERELVEYARAQNILQLESGERRNVNLDSDSIVALNTALNEAEAARIEAEQRYLEAQSNPQALSFSESEDLSRIRELRSELVSEYESRRGAFGADFPSMRQLQSRIENIDEQIARERQGILAALQGEYRALVGKEAALRTRIEELKSDVQDLRDRQINYQILQREVDTNRAQYEALLQRLKEVGVIAGVGSSQLSIVDQAEPPKYPFEPNIKRRLAVGMFFSLGFGVGLAFVLNYIDDTIKSPEDVKNKLGTVTIGVIPKQKDGERSIVASLSDPRSPICEAFFSARTALEFSSSSGMPSTLLFTSTRPAEGKSSCTISMATVLARTGRRVLIIDADMRKPSFETGTTESIGLSGLLTQNRALIDEVVPSENPGLSLLPSGTVPPNPAELLSSGRFPEILREAQQHFDIVLVDSPPVLSFADAPILAASCDATLVVVEAGGVRRPSIQHTINRLLESKANLIGVVLTKFDADQGGQQYGYYQYAYGKAAEEYSEQQLSARARDRRRIKVFASADDHDGAPRQDRAS
ncbi:exopolysaccharide biosynthesis protein [Parvularcula bermudensis HTCC2503]|uniref:non-specific protein-tyrosine kinase n=1 Tax=Parvularcula bermudensis (strain ATCC BAA-594 / HTCC2503 / KCTC 12087) TaxID=314260 RepID=E0TCG3_PARBH|nr:polysaccharide biosynthesis tyrosine autokinase [Parvularcula bermudensis]ADM10319.1 exopolysaccharide biosynthesis protein [Parvularcula bermudensis HTCC2503]